MSVARRKDGKSPFFQYEFEIDGQRFRGSTKCTSQREAEAFERSERERARQEITARLARQAAPDTVDDVFARYWKAEGHKLKWAYTVERHMRDMLAFFGATKLFSEIGNADVSAMLEDYATKTTRRGCNNSTREADGTSPGTVNRRRAVLRRIYNKARLEWELTVKPIDWTAHKRAEPDERVRHIEAGKAREVIGYLPRHILEMAAWSFATGCRLNETETLPWARVNFETRQAEVLTKGGGTRFVNLGPDALHILSLCDRNRALVFDSTNRRKHWEAACKKAGISDFRWHDMRHCFATWIGNKGADIAVIRDLLGHADIRTTAKYRRVIRPDTDKAVQSLPTLVEGNVVPLKREASE